MDKFNTHQVTMGIKKSIKQQNSKQKRHIAPKSKEFRSWILRKVIDNGKNNSLNIWILDDPKIWGTHLNRREVVMRIRTGVRKTTILPKSKLQPSHKTWIASLATGFSSHATRSCSAGHDSRSARNGLKTLSIMSKIIERFNQSMVELYRD